MKKWLFRGGLTVVLLLAGLFFAARALQTSPRPVPAAVPGYARLQITPAHRQMPVTLHLWYPTDAATPPALIGQNALFYGAWARVDAPARAGNWPVVVISHGSGGNGPRLAWLAADLAARGVIVAAPDHPGTTSGDSDPALTPQVWNRTADISAVLDTLLGPQPHSQPDTQPGAPSGNLPAGLTADPGRITALGFSLGGYTALGVAGARLSKSAFMDYCKAAATELECGWMTAAGVDFTTIDAARYEASARDPRITATIAIDPALTRAMTPESLAAVAQPVLVVNLGLPQDLPLGLASQDTASAIPGADYHALPGARHFSFLAECSALGKLVIASAGEDDICSDANQRPRAEIHAELATLITAFLTRTGTLP